MKPWRGIPREEIPWYPRIDTDRCTGCRACVEFCRNDVLEFDEAAAKTKVKNPFHCVVECSACARLCPEGAITFIDDTLWTAFIKDRLSRRGEANRSASAGAPPGPTERNQP